MGGRVCRVLLVAVSLVFGGTAGGLTATGAAVGATPVQYGAIAYSPGDQPSDSSYGRAFGSDKSKTIYAAAADCHQRTKAGDCQAVVWFGHGYGSLARASNGSYGSGAGSTPASADDSALKVCRDEGGNDCHLIVRMGTTAPGAGFVSGSPGRACVFLARVSPLDIFIQHVGWAFRTDNRGTNPWAYGATEGPAAINPAGPPWYVAPGTDDTPVTKSRSWSRVDVTWAQVKAAFYQGGPYDSSGYYVSYRCRDTLAANPTVAWNTWDTQTHQGYGVKALIPADNNCLTHAIATLRGYGAADLPSGAAERPAIYYGRVLTSLAFLPSETLP